MQPYCRSRFSTIRRASREVLLGSLGVGGSHPIRIQSMTTTPTQDVGATVAQAIALAEAGCEVVRITAQNVKAAAALKQIREQFSAAGFAATPLVADIHFLPSAAMEAARWVEKVRINPGNYADKKKFAQREYSDSEYDEEIERLHEAFSPIVLRCRDLGRAMRIGTNHGSLSDRIMNRYGDTPLGMVESALEFLRIAESHDYHNIIISMKASNPKVMIQAYRLMVSKMEAEGMTYPLHLGVTEAGDGDDARIKSAIGIGSLLRDGLGDTIRVSLTEDPVLEVPVARDLADKAMAWWQESPTRTTPDPIDPYSYRRREVVETTLGRDLAIGPLEPPRVIHRLGDSLQSEPEALAAKVRTLQRRLGDAPIEGLLVEVADAADLRALPLAHDHLAGAVKALIWEVHPALLPAITGGIWPGKAGDVLLVELDAIDAETLSKLLAFADNHDLGLAFEATPEAVVHHTESLLPADASAIWFTLRAEATPEAGIHPLGRYRQLAEVVSGLGLAAPIWIRNTAAALPAVKPYFGDQLLEASVLTGALLCDGIGDAVSVELVGDDAQAVTLAYNILQGARARTTKTEFVACPSCGRTLFDLQSTTQRIRTATGHLKGVTIAVMGCIVNGPGEMADADFGYVGGAPGKINLYVGKECVRFHIPASEAVEALIDLIKEHHKWVEPPVATSP